MNHVDKIDNFLKMMRSIKSQQVEPPFMSTCYAERLVYEGFKSDRELLNNLLDASCLPRVVVINQDLADQIIDLAERKIRRYDNMVLRMDYVGLICVKLHRVKREKPIIANYKDAEDKGVLKSYFGENDILECTKGEGEDYSYAYSGDYYDYLLTKPLKERVKIYLHYLMFSANNIPIRHNTYTSPETFYVPMMRQIAEYYEMIRQLDGPVIIPGDGAGAASIACIFLGKSYYSSEPALIGTIAVKLGIITNNLNLAQMMNEQIQGSWFLAQLGQELISYFVANKRELSYVVIDQTCECGDDIPVKGSMGRIFSNVELRYRLNKYPIRLKAIQNLQPVKYGDKASRNVLRDFNIEENDKKGNLISANRGPGMCIYTSQYPEALSRATGGEIKNYSSGVDDFKIRAGDLVSSDIEVFRYSPLRLDFGNTLMAGTYEVLKYGYYRSVCTNPYRIKFVQLTGYRQRVRCTAVDLIGNTKVAYFINVARVEGTLRSASINKIGLADAID